MEETKLASIPNTQLLLLKALFKRASFDPHRIKGITLPTKALCFEKVELKEKHVGDFHQVVGWELGVGHIHPCYLHSVAFPLHLKLLLLTDFPFSLLGLVHINNQITQMRNVKVGERLSVTGQFGQLEIHSKGWLFSINVEFLDGSEIVWKSKSTNLFLCKHEQNVGSVVQQDSDAFSHHIKTDWILAGNLGRRYAKASGDYNPIHLSKWSAKLFGFELPIIHGMWTKSYCLSKLQKINPVIFNQGFVVDTRFKQPLYLPNQVQMMVRNSNSDCFNGESHFKVVASNLAKGQQLQHLIGHIHSI